MDEHNGHGLSHRQPAADLPHTLSGEAVLGRLDVDPDQGLTSDQAAHRLIDLGFNRRVQLRRVTFWQVLREEVLEPMILLLLAVAVLYSVWGKLEDTVAIIVVIVAVVLVEVFTEYRAKAAIAALSRLSAPTAPVVRGGRIQDVPTETLVPGDLLLLRPGELLAADARLIETAGLRVDESALTGESVAVGKGEDILLAAATPLGERANLVFAGSTVVAGHGRAVVIATGTATELGRITGLVSEAKPPRTGLQQAMRDLARWLAWLALGFSVLVPLIGVFGGQPWREMILTGLTLAFATIPEELPIIISMVLGLGAYRLSRHHALVKRLRAAETLGTVTVVATDKTGTLTENRMILTHLITDRVASLGNPSESQQHLLALAAACHDAAVVRHDDTLQVAGDPTDAALLDAAHALRLLPGDSGGIDGVLASVRSFDTRRKIMSVTYRGKGGELSLIVKGAPEEILARCSRRLIGGQELTLTGADRDRFRTQLEQLAAEGLRVIAVATRTLPDLPGASISADETERQLTLVGLAGLADPPRPEAAESVRILRQAGIRVLMITGDHPVTARASAAPVG
ncbi:MAG: cation-translocating P-type ATPase, partial [Microbacteriaceae bacterium]